MPYPRRFHYKLIHAVWSHPSKPPGIHGAFIDVWYKDGEEREAAEMFVELNQSNIDVIFGRSHRSNILARQLDPHIYGLVRYYTGALTARHKRVIDILRGAEWTSTLYLRVALQTDINLLHADLRILHKYGLVERRQPDERTVEWRWVVD